MVSAATAAYDAGRGDLVAVLDARSTLLNYEFEYAKSLTDFAKKLAELQEVAGSDVLQEAAP
jgi:outer membrane protein TolC